MRRLLIVLVSSLVLGLVGGVGTAMAGDLLTPPSGTPVSQTATQSNDGSNTANQSGTSEPIVASGPNIAVANGASCNPCGGGGTTNQNSGNIVDASNTNSATQSNNQSNGAGQTQTASQGASDPSQSADQSNKADNTANQSGTSKPIVVSGPNVAALNGGDVNQNSGNYVDASNHNSANQSNTQSNGAGQSQTVAGNGCCSSDGASQSASQSNEGSNNADQRGYSAPIVVSGGNYAIANKGDVNQNSGNWVDASNHNTANQSNTQSNGAGQSQTVAGNGCCHSGDVSQSADQSNSASNEANQSGYSAPLVVSGPNVAVGNGWVHDACNSCAPAGGDVNQNSGNWVDASNHNTATQSNNQWNGLGQTQTVTGSGCCGSGKGDVSQSASQSNRAENTANQCGSSAPVVVSGKNVAFLNGGDVNQNSGNWVDASNHNTATQSNTQSNNLGQTQTVNGEGCCPKPCERRCDDSCEPKCESRCEPKCESRCEPKCEPRCEPKPCQKETLTPARGRGVI